MSWEKEDLESLSDTEIKLILDETCNKCYSNLLNMGLDSFGTMSKEVMIETLSNMIKHFESNEEFEKCSRLSEFKNQVINGEEK